MEMMELEKLHSFLCEEHLLPQIWEEKISDSARVQRGGGGDEGSVEEDASWLVEEWTGQHGGAPVGWPEPSWCLITASGQPPLFTASWHQACVCLYVCSQGLPQHPPLSSPHILNPSPPIQHVGV